MIQSIMLQILWLFVLFFPKGFRPVEHFFLFEVTTLLSTEEVRRHCEKMYLLLVLSTVPRGEALSRDPLCVCALFNVLRGSPYKMSAKKKGAYILSCSCPGTLCRR